MTVLDASAPPQAGLDRVLGSLDWILADATRVLLEAGDRSKSRLLATGFTYVSSGRGSLRIGTVDRTLERGDVVFFARPQLRRIVAETDMDLVHVAFAPRNGSATDALPDAVVAEGFADREPNLIALVESMPCGGAPRPGDAIICSRIASTVAIAAIRVWAELGCVPRAWLQGADDPHIGPVLAAMHADLERPWTVEDLARVGMMSRSAFAARFRDVVGRSPLSYLASARVESGIELLRAGDLTVSQIALRLGYGSEDGFSRAFRRHTGSTPATWRAASAGRAPGMPFEAREPIRATAPRGIGSLRQADALRSRAS